MISGETLQSIAEVSFYSEMTDIITNQINSKSQNLKRIEETDSVKEYKIIFVYTQAIDQFLNKFFNQLDNVVLITHNSDIGIHSNHLHWLEGSNIKAWFCQNREVYHPKLFSLPIGLANSQWKHGDQCLITEIREKQYTKINLVYKNFDINTNRGQRHECDYITHQNNILHSPHTTIEGYWKNISESFFVISPPGNGIDCHRIWEALYLRTIPIIKFHEAFTQFIHLPILFVDNWHQVTIPYLREQVIRFKDVDFNINELKMEYWQQKIYETNQS